MQSNTFKAILGKTGLAASLLLIANGVALASAVTLTASPQSTTLPDGQVVPMWGYTCGATPTNATCTAANGSVQTGGTTWQPPLITVPGNPTGPTALTITLVNNLTIPTLTSTGTAGTPTLIPTSLVIVGQLGGGLGDVTQRTTMPSPTHAPQGTTWPGTLGDADASSCLPGGDPGAAGTFCPPAQDPRVRSFGTEVPAGCMSGASCGGTTLPQLTWSNLRPGTYLIESGTEPSIQGPMGLYGVVVVTDPAGLTTAYGTSFDKDVALLLSEIDPLQNGAVNTAVRTSGFSDTRVWNGQPGQCGDAAVHSCYPPAVNYSPGYYLINGVSFDRTDITIPAKSALAVPAAGTQTRVLLRFVNAGLRMHTPSVVGATLSLIAEDGNKLPGIPKMQSELLLVPGKTSDVTIQPKQTTAGTYDAAVYGVFDRALGISTNNQPDGGMQAYLQVAGGALPTTGFTLSGATDKTYYCIAGTKLAITDPAKGVLAGAVGANGAALGTFTGAVNASRLIFKSNGTFTYTPPATGACGGSFTYLVNGQTSATHTATITQCDASTGSVTGCTLAGAPVVGPIQFTSNVAARYTSAPPGVLAGVTSNPGGLALTAVGPAEVVNADGSFVATNTVGSIATCPTVVPALPTGTVCREFSYQAKNAQGTLSNTSTATVIFLPPSNLAVNVRDAKNNVAVSDYRWIIEEDKTFWIDPKCQINTTAARTDSNGRPCPALPVESLGYSFHTANMPVIAAGCVGAISCEAGQTQGGPTNLVACDVGNGTCRPAAQKTEVRPSAVYLDPLKRYYISILPGDGVNTTIGGAGGTAGGSANVTQSGRTITVTDPVGFFGIVVGDTIVLDGSSVATANGACTVTALSGGSLSTQSTPTTLTCTVPANRSGSGTSTTDVAYAGTRQFDVSKDCGAYDPTKYWWQAGNLGNAAGNYTSICGHAMGGAQIAQATGVGTRPAVNILLQQTPLPTSKISVFVFKDDFPLNGENDAGGGIDVIAPNEPGLGGFELKVFDQAGGLGDPTGQITYDEFNMPVSNSLAGTIDPVTTLDACPITVRGDGLVGMIPTCPTFESDGVTMSPLAGQAVIANLYPGLYEIVATPAADRIARGEEWLQTNTLDGTKPHEVFIIPNEPSYFQEFGPGGYHVSIGFANPKIINDRKTGAFCTSMGGCNAPLNVQVTSARMSRSPDQRIYSSGDYSAYGFTQCYVSVGPPDGEDFALEKCDENGVAHFTGLPIGDFKLTVFDQWNDLLVDGLVSPVKIDGGATVKEFPVTQWRTNLSTRTFIDTNHNGVSDDGEPGLALVNTNIRYRDGSLGFFNNTDLDGNAGFNEVFPFLNWLVVETSSTRFKQSGTHVVYDAGGPADGTPGGGTSAIADHVANTGELVSPPSDQRVPGAVYCADADCSAASIETGAGNVGGICPTDANGITACIGGLSTGRIDPPMPWGPTEAWQGLLGQTSFIEFGMTPFQPGENGGIAGHVIYASTRPFDDPALSLQLSWEPGVPHVTVNLYQKTVDSSGNEHLTLVDHTTTSSWDDWAQGFRSDGVPNMNCPGQDPTSPFFQTLMDSKQWLDPNKTPLTNRSLFKCFDGWSQLNQVQPAPYDGMYKFPSVTGINPKTGKPAGTNCDPTVCTDNPTGDGTQMLPAGKYVVEVVLPDGYELVKEEDKNILLGDVYIAPVTQQFGGPGNIFIMPDQAAVNAYYNGNNPGSLNLTTNLGASPRHEGDTGSVETFWKCVGAERIVPDLNSLYPGAGQAAPFAGAKRNLCDRKEVVLQDEMSVLAKFYIFSSTHVAGHFTGTMTNDFASEFDPFSPQFGEKFSPPNLPVGLRDFAGKEMGRVYADQWGLFDGLFFSTYSVNPPNPTGYIPQMAIACMNDPGTIPATNSLGQYVDAAGAVVASVDLAAQITDPAYSPAYSNFCYEQPFMPGFTAYMDTPVIPTMAFADGYNLPDSEYPDATPAIKTVMNSTNTGPWIDAGRAEVRASVSFSIGSVSQQSNTATTPNDRVNSVAIGGTPLNSAALRCGPSVSGSISVDCSSTSQTTRNTNMATAVRSNINANTTGGLAHGYTATGTSANVIITAPAGTGAGANGRALAFNQTGLTAVNGLSLSGGVTATAGTTTRVLTITALGDKVVQNPNFSGPNAATVPYNQKTITRHYGFGSGGTVALVGSDGVNRPLTSVSWSDTTISGTVPSDLPNCVLQQLGQPAAQCGQLVITRSDNGKQSIDTITVTVGGKPPTVVSPTTAIVPGPFGRTQPSPLQTAIDNATPGDLIIVTPGTYRENLIMWKPVRLQGVGAESVTINADAHPAGKMDSWRRQVACLFGLTVDGGTNPGNAAFDASGTYLCPPSMFFRSDRIPFEAFVGWDAAGNGNLAQILQEPTLMGAYEGAGITVTGRGVNVGTSTDFWGQATPAVAGAFPDGSRYLRNTTTDCSTTARTNGHPETDYGTGNYQCNPSRIDGVSIINSSQGGGGIFEHGWNHYLEIANTRIYGNHGTLSGAINLGNGETPPIYTNDGTICGAGAAPLCPPFGNGANASLIGSLPVVANGTIPFQLNVKNHVHHNMIINNASIGDALFSGTPSGSGGITISAGDDNYTIDHNWIAGNLSSGDGAGMGHQGVTFNGTIANNWILFNQSINPTLPTNGGGLLFAGASADRTLPNGLECGSVVDVDCPPGIGDGAGQGNVINANLIMGNSAESGSGGGLRLQQVNGSEVGTFPILNTQWYAVTVTNNVIADNVAGWDGGGVSMQDALKVTLVNNTIVSNDTTASAGVLYKALGAINSSAPPPGCIPTPDPLFPQNTLCLIPNAPHGPQPAGLVTMANTPNLIASLPGIVNCPVAFGYTGTLGINGDCRQVSKPAMANNMFWQNRAFHVDIVGPGSGNQSQQNIIALTPLLNQSTTGQCASGANYWDVGIRTDDLAAGTVTAGTQLTMANSILTSTAGVAGNNNFAPGGSPVVAQYCNGARMPPEHCTDAGIDLNNPTCKGFNAPPGRSETTGLSPVFVFNNITPSATVDEGNNWLNLTYGPLTLNRSAVQSTSTNPPELMVASATVGATGGAYSISGTSAAVNRGTNTGAPATDFFGQPRARTTANPADIGAVEFQIAANSTLIAANPAPLGFTDVVAGQATTTPASVTFSFSNVIATRSVTSVVIGATIVTTGTVTCPALTCGLMAVADRSTFIATGVANSINAGSTGYTATSSGASITITAPAGTGAALNGTTVTVNRNAVLGASITITPTAPVLSGGSNSAVATATRDLTLSNNGTTTFTIPALTFTGPFSRNGGTCGGTLAAGALCTITVQWNGVPATATSAATAVVTAGSVTGFTSIVGGSGYTSAPTVLLIGGGGMGASATAVITAGAVSAINVNTGGSGYTSAPAVVLSGGDRPLGDVTITGVSNSPVTINANTVAALSRASVGPSPLAFGNWAIGTTSNAMSLTVSNVGNVALAGGAFTFNVATPFTRATAAQGGAGSCGPALAVGASCTYNVVFAPTTATAYSATANQRTLTVAYTGATVDSAAVTLTGTGVAARAAVSIAPLTITLMTGTVTDDSAIILTNAAPTGGAQMTVSGVAITCGGVTLFGGTSGACGSTLLGWFFNLVPGQDACTGHTLPPGGTCTVAVRFTNVSAATGVNRLGTISFTSNGTPSPAPSPSTTRNLTGFATP